MINSVKNWFWRSETIAWARLQILFGVVWGVVSVADLSPLLSGKWLTIWLIFNGIVTEFLRRHRAVQETVMVPETAKDGSVESVPKSFLASPPPGP
jgi:hypothetical protein